MNECKEEKTVDMTCFINIK